MQLSVDAIRVHLNATFDQMLAVAQRLGEPLINVRPFGSDTNSVAALVVHCCGVVEFWLGHVALGEPDHRDRDAEFAATPTLAELGERVAAIGPRAVELLERLEGGAGTDDGGRQFLPGGDTTDAAVVLHVLQELYQHLGHMELTADALLTQAPDSDASDDGTTDDGTSG